MNVESINLFLVFSEGVISFFSPCVLPLIPMYLGYLSGKGRNEEGTYSQGRVVLHTLFFILGIATTFFMAAFLTSTLSMVLHKYSVWIGVIGGLFLIGMGLIQLGVFSNINFKREFRLPFNFTKINFLNAYLMGFCFSFAWTPCIGPMLSSVMVLAASSASMSSIYILIYALGFMIPFLLVGLFSSYVLNFMRKFQSFLSYTVKVGAVILIVLGGFLLKQAYTTYQTEQASQQSSNEYDFELYDQFGEVHRLSDYKGKEIILVFTASWCPYCNMELEELEALYQEYQNEDVVILGVMAPSVGKELNQEDLMTYIEDKNVNFPILIDEGGVIFYKYGVSSLPTTFVLNKHNEFYGYQTGLMGKDILERVIEDVRETY